MDITEKENKDIKIRGVKVANDNLLQVNNHLPKNVFFSIICGAPGSGKSSLWQNLLGKYYKGVFDKIYLFTGSIHTLPDTLLSKLHPKRVFDEISVENLEPIIEATKQSQEKTLLILDDCIADINRQKDLKNLIKKIAFNRRHIPVYVMLITQKLKEIPLNIRSVSDSIFFYNFNNKKEVEAFYDDFVSTLEKDEYRDLIKYMNDKNEGYDFLYLNRHKGKDKWYRNFNSLSFERDE